MGLTIIEHRMIEISQDQFNIFKTCYEKTTGQNLTDEFIECINKHNYYDYADTKYLHRIENNNCFYFAQPAILFSKSSDKNGFTHFYIDSRLHEDILDMCKEE